MIFNQRKENEMENQMPAVLKMRAERILQKSIKAIYKTDKQSIAKCILQNGEIKYVDLDTRKQVSLVSVDAKKAGKEDTGKLITGNFHSAITRSNVETAPDFISEHDKDADPEIGERLENDMKKAFVKEAPEEKPKKRQTKKSK